jgi:hypothetical protein
MLMFLRVGLDAGRFKSKLMNSDYLRTLGFVEGCVFDTLSDARLEFSFFGAARANLRKLLRPGYPADKVASSSFLHLPDYFAADPDKALKPRPLSASRLPVAAMQVGNLGVPYSRFGRGSPATGRSKGYYSGTRESTTFLNYSKRVSDCQIGRPI